MNCVRQARREDAARIAEILVFNYRLNFYPIFQNDAFYFGELTAARQAADYAGRTDHIWVYDDGVVKGFIQVEDQEIKKLFVEPILQGQAIGAELLEFAIREKKANTLWALEKNERAIRFYRRHGFRLTAEKRPEEGTSEYLVRMER